MGHRGGSEELTVISIGRWLGSLVEGSGISVDRAGTTSKVIWA